MTTKEGDRVIAWLHLEDREEYGDHDEDDTPIEWTREVRKSVTIGSESYEPGSLSRSVPITEKEAAELLRETDATLPGVLYKKLGVTSLCEYPGLPKGPYYDPVNPVNIRSYLQEALKAASGE